MATPREVDTHARTFIHHFSLHQTINSSMDSRHAICCLGLSRNVGSVDSLNWNVHSICLSDNLNGNLHNFSINETCEYFVDGNGSGNDLSFLGLGGGGIGGCCCAIRSDICNDRPWRWAFLGSHRVDLTFLLPVADPICIWCVTQVPPGGLVIKKTNWINLRFFWQSDQLAISSWMQRMNEWSRDGRDRNDNNNNKMAAVMFCISGQTNLPPLTARVVGGASHQGDPCCWMRTTFHA